VGLTEQEAARRLSEDGPNDLPSEKPRGVLPIVAEVVRQPMFLMLLAAGAIYLATGEPTDAALLLGFVVVVMGITVVQERRTERALDALRDLSSPRALVVREGVRRRIPGREVVRGDFVVLSEGDRVPADGLLRARGHLEVDESLLTGEAVPVRKATRESGSDLDRPGGDDLASVFSGTLVTSGQGVAEIVATGERTELGRIGRALAEVQPEPTALERETSRLVKTFAVVGLGTSALVGVAYAATRGADAWKEGLLAAIALAMAILPEEFPVILTVFLALGAWRLSRSRVLTRRMPAVETLGAATVLCVDKTGTLTQNRMTLQIVAVGEDDLDLGAAEDPLDERARFALETASLASRLDPFDPMELAVKSAAERLLGPEATSARGSLLVEHPLSAQLLAVTHVVRRGPDGPIVAASKGAPEAIAELCGLDEATRAALHARVVGLAERGLRVLGLARSTLDRAPDDGTDPRALGLRFVGLVGFVDPLREGVPAAVAECRAAGVRIVMITGDYPATAASIAKSAGLASTALLTGEELDRMSDEALEGRIRDVDVFARVVPEQKLRIVRALSRRGEIVAMTGDGVNDAPALRAAHIGVAMGGRGTDVAREASSLVLLDDAFPSIVAAIRLGRRVFDNIQKAVAFVLAVHVPIAGLSILPVLAPSWPLILSPVHIVFLELIIDPSCSLVFEAEEAEADVMARPPRPPGQSLFGARATLWALLQGGLSLSACVLVHVMARARWSPDATRALTFTTLVTSFLLVIAVNRSWSRSALAMLRARNVALAWVATSTVLFLSLALAVPFARRLFHFGEVTALGVALAVGAALVPFGLLEAGKTLRRTGRGG
jgi:Ca2+-transporting ATPase